MDIAAFLFQSTLRSSPALVRAIPTESHSAITVVAEDAVVGRVAAPLGILVMGMLPMRLSVLSTAAIHMV